MLSLLLTGLQLRLSPTWQTPTYFGDDETWRYKDSNYENMRATADSRVAQNPTGDSRWLK